MLIDTYVACETSVSLLSISFGKWTLCYISIIIELLHIELLGFSPTTAVGLGFPLHFLVLPVHDASFSYIKLDIGH